MLRRIIVIIIIDLNVFILPVYAVPPWCPDLSPNDTVDFADFAVLSNNWHQSGSSLQGDFDGSGMVDINDLEYLNDH